MPITAICPKCESRYQFDAALLGQKIRCTNPKCREIFEVKEAAEPKGAKPRDRRAPSFDADSGELKPVKAAAPAADEPREADWSKLPPPPIRSREEEVFEAEELTVTGGGDPEVASADEVLAFMGMSPAAAATAEPSAEDYTLPAEGQPEEVIYDLEDDEVATDYDEMIHHYQGRPKRRWAAYAVLALFVFTGAAIAGALFYMKSRAKGDLDKQVAAADEELRSKHYKQAATLYEKLITKDDKNKTKYKFLWDYAKAMDAGTDVSTPVATRESELDTSMATLGNSNKEELEKFYPDIKDAFVRIAEERVKDATIKAGAQDFVSAETGQKAADLTKKRITIYGSVPEDLEKKYAALTEMLGEGRRFAKFLEDVRKELEQPTPKALAKARSDAREAGYSTKPDIIRLFDEADKAIIARIVFTPAKTGSPEAPRPVDLTSLIIAANSSKELPAQPSIVYAIARGVLYAMAEGKGDIVWAARVGIDTASLPVRVPAAGRLPALVLVPSSDGLGLTAREALTGTPKWFQKLPHPLRGQPLLVEGRVVAPLADENGTVVVIEARTGQLHGHMTLGQKIGAGAALQPGSSRVFVPAESENVFVLDANPPFVAAGADPVLMKYVYRLETGHGQGSLRAEPVVVGGIAEGKPTGTGYLILTLSDGVADMKLRSFPFTPTSDEKLSMVPDQAVTFTLPGWCWFPPVCDEERIAIVTDSGALAVLGINQKQNEDKPLFLLAENKPKSVGAAGRGLIVHAEEQGFWYLANGEMNYMIKGLNMKEGQKLAPGWGKSIKLGTPLHAAQVSADRQTLYVVTQTSSPPSWQITAVVAKTGAIAWQRPLGLAAHGNPVKLGDVVYQIDQSAGVYAYDPKAATQPAGPEAILGGQVLAQPRTDVVGEPYLLKHPKEDLAFVLFTTGDGRKLNAVVVKPGTNASAAVSVDLAAPLAGPPVVTADNTFVMALSDGLLHRWKFPGNVVEPGLDWRGGRPADANRAYITLLPNDGVLVTDGARNLTHYQWSPGAKPQQKSGGIQVRDKIISAPVLLPAKDNTVRVAVADSAGKLHILEGDPLATAPSTTWDMRNLRKGNEITAGPFVIDDKGESSLVVIADRTTVVCLKLDSPKEAWSYKIKGDGIPLPPRQAGDALLISDVSGRYESLGVADGAPLATPYPATTPLPAAPAAAPLPVGDKIFAPLTDGTILLIPAAELLPKK